jgi:hypothetical protein
VIAFDEAPSVRSLASAPAQQARHFTGLASDILKECRADPAKDARLVRTLIAATDPFTQKRLSDKDIADELIVFPVTTPPLRLSHMQRGSWGAIWRFSIASPRRSLGSPKRH